MIRMPPPPPSLLRRRNAFDPASGLDPHCTRRVSRLLLPALLLLGLLSSLASEPYLRLRESTLGYNGSENDFTNLTEIRIGWFGPTNLDDPLTGDLWWAASLAVSEANLTDGAAVPNPFGRMPVRLVPRWAVDPWGTGVSQLTRMVYDEQPLVLLGSIDSATTHLAEQVVAKANLPLVSPVATDKSVTLAGVSWMFSCAPDDDVIARVLVEEILAALQQDSTAPTAARSDSTPRENSSDHPKRPGSQPSLVLISCTDHESRMTAREVLKELNRRNAAPARRIQVPPAAEDLSQQLAAIEAVNPTAVLIVAGPEDAARLVRAIRRPIAIDSQTVLSSADPQRAASNGPRHQARARLQIFGTHGLARSRFADLAGTLAEGVCCPLLFLPATNRADTLHFLNRFRAERHHPPDSCAALTYDAARLLIAAVRCAGPNRARIREELIRLSPWSGIAGPIQFDGTGQNTRSNLCLGIYRQGTLVPLPLVTRTSLHDSRAL